MDLLTNLTLSLAARIGVGSLAGVALAIYYGGAGSVFWIWVLGVVTSINTYCESYLGVKYQKKENGSYIGGPAFYIKKAFKKKFFSYFYAILVIFTYIFGFITIQSNTISVSLYNCFGIGKFFCAVLLMIITYFSIIKGLKRVEKITSILVPIMGLIYISLFLYVVFTNYYKIPMVFMNIIKSAFNIKSFTSGFITTFIIGVQRGIFCTESGLGTGAIASSTVKPKDKVSYSKSQILGIYFTVFVVCTSTALIILTSNYQKLLIKNANGIELVLYSVNYHFGSFGNIILLLIIVCLAFSTIIAGYYYGESNLNFLIKNKKCINILKILTIISVGFGTISKSNIIWNFVDLFVSFLAILNMLTIFKLKNEIINDYEKS